MQNFYKLEIQKKASNFTSIELFDRLSCSKLTSSDISFGMANIKVRFKILKKETNSYTLHTC